MDYKSVGLNTTQQVDTWTTDTSNYAKSYSYTYDNRGNIIAIDDGENTTSYEYDSLDQLTRENNEASGKTWTYEYD